MEGALRARLLAAAPVTAKVGTRVYWDDRPQSSSLPAVLLTVISDIRDQTLKGFDMPEARVQADVLALSFADKKALKEAVIAALAPAEEINGIQFMRATDISAVPRNERTDTQFVFRDAIDFLIRWKITA
jgi:hypothetical protein